MPSNRTLLCVAGHSFDRAKQGYVNLLLKRRYSGDTSPMLMARRRFLEQGLFDRFADALADMVLPALAEVPPERALLDAGCGEGYYLRRLAARLAAANLAPPLLALDVSRDAVALAAKAQPGGCFVVADVTERLPVADESLHVIINLFAPHNFSEFHRTLAPGGRLVLGFPTARHFSEVREALGLLQIDEDKEERLIARAGAGWRVAGKAAIAFPLTLSAENIETFVTMSPNQWHRSREAAEPPAGPIATMASFVLLALQR